MAVTPSKPFNEIRGFVGYASVEKWDIDANKLRIRLLIENSIYNATAVIHAGRR